MNVCAVCEFWIKVKTQNRWVRAMGSAVLFILISGLLLYSTGSGVNRVQVVFSGFSVKLSCLSRQKLYIGMVVYISWLHSRLSVWV